MMLTSTGPIDRSPAADRMRLHRQRRRAGMRCLMIELRETEIDALIRKGFLKAIRVTTQAQLSTRYMRISIKHWGRRAPEVIRT